MRRTQADVANNNLVSGLLEPVGLSEIAALLRTTDA